MRQQLKFNNIIPGLTASVEFYAKAIYDWSRHNNDEIQTKADVNKPGSFISIFKDDEGNLAFVMRAKNPSELKEEIKQTYTEETVKELEELIKKDFYFLAIQKTNSPFEELEFPDEIFLTKKEACDGACLLLQNI